MTATLTPPSAAVDVLDVDLSSVVPCQHLKHGAPDCDRPATRRITARCCGKAVNLCGPHAARGLAAFTRQTGLRAARGARVRCFDCSAAPHPGYDWRKL